MPGSTRHSLFPAIPSELPLSISAAVAELNLTVLGSTSNLGTFVLASWCKVMPIAAMEVRPIAASNKWKLRVWGLQGKGTEFPSL